jgi:hypothetical protein
MKGHFREFTENEVKEAFEEGRFEELTAGLKGGRIDWAVANASSKAYEVIQQNLKQLVSDK